MDNIKWTKNNNYAIISLVFCILSLTIIFFFVAPISILFGVLALRKIKKSEESGKKMAIVGITISSIVLLIMLLILSSNSFFLNTTSQSIDIKNMGSDEVLDTYLFVWIYSNENMILAIAIIYLNQIQQLIF